MTARLLAVRLDSLGDVLVTGPAIRAMAASGSVDVLVGPLGRAAAELLPGVNRVITWDCPWISATRPPVTEQTMAIVPELAAGNYDAAVIFTSYHQSPLPTALLLRLAGVSWVGAYSEDYPGTLLDLRAAPPGDIPEPVRALQLAKAAGFELPASDAGTLQVLPVVDDGDRRQAVPPGDYVVLHPGTSVPARAWAPRRWRETCQQLAPRHQIVVTGTAAQYELCRYVAGTTGVNLAGQTTLRQLAQVLSSATAVVVGNTGPAHLAAAVKTPVVSVFAPTVPAARWRPYGVPVELLTPARAAIDHQPDLDSISAADVAAAVDRITGASKRVSAISMEVGT